MFKALKNQWNEMNKKQKAFSFLVFVLIFVPTFKFCSWLAILMLAILIIVILKCAKND